MEFYEKIDDIGRVCTVTTDPNQMKAKLIIKGDSALDSLENNYVFENKEDYERFLELEVIRQGYKKGAV